jgi:excisionase family DNA binding protein
MDTKEQAKRLGQSYLTVAQAAEQLGVHPSTIRRWIDAGLLRAYRVGPKRIALKETDLRRAVAPRTSGTGVDGSKPKIRDHMTKEEQRRGLKALAELERLSAQLAAKYGKPDVEGWVLINEARDERTRHLMEISEGHHE